MDKAYLRRSNGTFDISFHLLRSEFNVDRRFNFSRKLDEPKKKKNEYSVVETEEYKVTASLLQDNSVIKDDVLCENIFKNTGKNVYLQVLDKNYLIIIDAPYIDAISLPNSILANFPVYPSKFEAVFTQKTLCEFIWYVSKDKESWNKASEGFIYTPSNADINSYLKLTCIPKNEQSEGPIVEVITDVTVDASPGECPFEYRHMFTKNRCTNNSFRVYKDKNINIIFCGDFNSVPDCGIYRLYTTGSVPEDIIDFKSNQEETIEGINLRQQFQLGSACGTPKYTNFTAGFADCLDYIFYDKTKLSVEQVIPLPTNEELVQNTALPSIVFPSDHISLVADLKFL
ncbi:carbon catabolite repressor protein 4 [Holotrichia oblita]|uniref:Carbon catabolite repressor protein 4 n=1 Tax=Holotrichia oblita TaxID=644536 RepID=A0ACB9TDM4_HOLOL|nr:carbon catabolite repressor protein 4 [Holotrichia oblita]